MATVTLYHYTDSSCKDGIIQDGYVKPSSEGHDGTFVYLTSMNPLQYSEEEISRNNFRAGWGSRLCAGRVEYSFEFVFPQNKVKKCRSSQFRRRDAWVYKEGDLKLDKYGTGILYHKKNGHTSTISIKRTRPRKARVTQTKMKSPRRGSSKLESQNRRLNQSDQIDYSSYYSSDYGFAYSDSSQGRRLNQSDQIDYSSDYSSDYGFAYSDSSQSRRFNQSDRTDNRPVVDKYSTYIFRGLVVVGVLAIVGSLISR